jgi:hypothetical protein
VWCGVVWCGVVWRGVAWQLEEANNELRVLQQFKGHPNIVEIVDTVNIGVGKKTASTRQVTCAIQCSDQNTIAL